MSLYNELASLTKELADFGKRLVPPKPVQPTTEHPIPAVIHRPQENKERDLAPETHHFTQAYNHAANAHRAYKQRQDPTPHAQQAMEHNAKHVKATGVDALHSGERRHMNSYIQNGQPAREAASTNPSKVKVKSTQIGQSQNKEKGQNILHHIGPYNNPHSSIATAQVSAHHHKIWDVSTRKDHKGKGYAHAIMKHVTDWADKNGHKLTLHASAEELKNQGCLESFYHKHGFVPNELGNSKDMTRYPKL